MRFNEKLKALRQSNNMTQDEVAERLSISRQSISKWEQGINEPNIETIKELSHIFNVSISELIDDDRTLNLSKEKRLKNIETFGFNLNLAINFLILLTSFVVVRVIVDKIPMHYNIRGQVTRYGSKYELFYFSAITLIFLPINFFTHFNIFKKNQEPIYVFTQFILAAVQTGFLITLAVWGFKFKKDTVEDEVIIILFTFAFLMVCSLFVSPIFLKKRNPYAGVRTKFTLSNDTAWLKINMMQFISCFTVSLICYVISIISLANWSIYLIFAVIASIIPTMIYQVFLINKVKKGIKL